MSAVRIIRTRGCKLAITGFTFEIQDLFGLLALRLTRLTAQWQPQQVQHDFILVDTIGRRNVLKGLSLRLRSIRKQNNSSSSRFKTVT